jgi:hypothetical protein
MKHPYLCSVFKTIQAGDGATEQKKLCKMKSIFILNGGLQKVQQNIETESFSSMSVTKSEAPDNVADHSFGFTNVYSTSVERIVEYLNKAYEADGITFSQSGMGDETLIDFNL